MYFSTGLAYAHMYTCVEVQLFFTAVMLIPVAEDKGHQIAAFMLVCVCPSGCHTMLYNIYTCMYALCLYRQYAMNFNHLMMRNYSG